MSQKYFVEVDDQGNRYWYSDPEMTVIHRLGGPAVEWANGDLWWYNAGQRHRLDGPAIEVPNGYRMWYQNDQLHRLDGPAIERADGSKEYWIDNTRIHARQFPKLSRKFAQAQRREMTMAQVEAALGHPVKIIK